MNKNSPTYGRPKVLDEYSTDKQGEDHNDKGICPAALGTKDEQPAAYSPDTQLFYVPTNHVCMDYEPFKVSYTAGQPYVGATLSMYPPKGETTLPTSSPGTARLKDRLVEQGAVLGLVRRAPTAGSLVFYGTLEGYLRGGRRQEGQRTLQVQNPVRHHW